MEAGNISGNLVYLFHLDLIKDHSSNYITEIITNSSPLYTFIFTALLAPIFEELILENSLLGHINTVKKCIILSGLIFGFSIPILDNSSMPSLFGAILPGIYKNRKYSIFNEYTFSYKSAWRNCSNSSSSHVDISSISEMSTQGFLPYVEGLDTALLCWCMAYSLLLMIFMFAAAIAGVILFFFYPQPIVKWLWINPPIITKIIKALFIAMPE